MQEDISKNIKEEEELERAWSKLLKYKSLDLSKHDDFRKSDHLSERLIAVGEPELAKRWAYAYFKKSLENLGTFSSRHGWSHVLPDAVPEMSAAGIRDELFQNLVVMCGRLSEMEGGFERASQMYELYEEFFPGKFSDKLKTVDFGYSGFHEAESEEEKERVTKEELNKFLGSIPLDVVDIDTKAEFRSLVEEIGKIVENKKIRF